MSPRTSQPPDNTAASSSLLRNIVLHGKLFRLARCFRIHDKWHRKVHNRVRVSPLYSFEREKPHRAAVLNVTRMEWERRENLPCNSPRTKTENHCSSHCRYYRVLSYAFLSTNMGISLRTFTANCAFLSRKQPLILAFRRGSEKNSDARLHFVRTTAHSLDTLTELLAIIAKGVVSL